MIYLPGALFAEAEERANRLQEALAGAELGALGLSASIGIAEREPDDTLDTLIQRADEAMFAAKALRRVMA